MPLRLLVGVGQLQCNLVKLTFQTLASLTTSRVLVGFWFTQETPLYRLVEMAPAVALLQIGLAL